MVKKARGGKRVKVGAFGRYLEGLRERERKVSVQAIAQRLRDRRIKVDDTTLRFYEYGCVDKPDPVVLLELARVYRTDIHRLIAVLAANRQNPNLSEFELDGVLRQVDERSHVETAAAARLAEVQKRLHEIAAELVDLAEADDGPGEQTPETGAAASASDPDA